MAIWTILLIIVAVILALYLLIEIRRMRHKFFAVFLIVIVVLGYFSFASVFEGRDINFKSFSGLKEATGIYFSWLGSLFGSLKSMTAKAINFDWSGSKDKIKVQSNQSGWS